MSGFIIGIGSTFLFGAIVANLSGIMRVDQVMNYYYIGFGTITLGAILAAYELAAIHKIADNVKNGKTSIE